MGRVLSWIDDLVTSPWPQECVVWPFNRNASGYGRMSLRERNVAAHRLILEIKDGPPPSETAQARHLCGCGHEGCVNPRHLAWGSPSENAEDARRHRAFARGRYRKKNATVAETIADIRASYSHGSAIDMLSVEYGYSRDTIIDIVTGRWWPGLQMDPFAARDLLLRLEKDDLKPHSSFRLALDASVAYG